MKILVFGGTRFFGKQLVEALIDAEHDVTIATRGKQEHPFGDKVRTVVLNRTLRDDVFRIANEKWDVVYDNICYSPQEASYAVSAFKDKVKRYIFTSSKAVYRNKDRELTESDFEPSTYEIIHGSKDDFDYGEGKRLAEAVFFQKATFPVVAVRFPIVLGEADYTDRLEFHIEHIRRGKEIAITHEHAATDFILDQEAARFLKWVGTETDVTGPINASSDGSYTLQKIIEIIESKVARKCKLEFIADQEDNSPFDIPGTNTLNTAKAKEAGFVFENLEDWFPKLVDTLIQSGK